MQVNLYEAKTQLSSLVERAAAGEQIIIAKNGEPCARLMPLARARPEKRRLGQLDGRLVLTGVDEPVDPELFEAPDPFLSPPAKAQRKPRSRPR